jgi:hypothetical protein
MPDIEERIRQLEERMRQAEDRLAIFQLMAGYGPAVDGNCQRDAANVWTEDGVYELDGKAFEGRANIVAMLESDQTRALINSGSAHVLSLPHIVIKDDTAVATCTSRLYRHAGDDFRVLRATANRWEFVRTPQGWRVKHRVNKTLDGSKESQALFQKSAGSSLVGT